MKEATGDTCVRDVAPVAEAGSGCLTRVPKQLEI